MGIWLIALCVLGLIYVFFQFGGRVAASRALPWWFVAVFVALAATKPELFAAVSQFLGIRYVSNFVLAGLVMFLFAQTFEAAGLISKLQRQIRGVETGVASKTYKPIGPGLKYLVIFPCFNESKSLPMLSDSIRTLCASHPSVGICFINDGSSDNTDSVLSSLQLPHVAHSCNLGVSAALLTGFKIATSIKTISAVIQCDSDGQHPIHEIPDLIKSFNHQYADCIVGSRFLDNKSLSRIRESTSPLRRFGGMIISSILWITSRGRISINDPTSGFRLYSMDAVRLLISQMPDDYPEPEVLAVLGRHGMKVREFNVSMAKRSAGSSSLDPLKSALYMIKVATALLASAARSFTLQLFNRG